MTQSLTPDLVRSIDAVRALGALTLSGSEALLRLHLDQTQALVTCNSSCLRTMLATFAGSPEEWSDNVQQALDEARAATREWVAASTKMQAETLRVIEQQVAEAQEIVTEALAVTPFDTDAPRLKSAAARDPATRGGRTRQHRLAA